MVVQNIECQLSTVLMKRFLDGDNLPQELLDELEQHLRVCPSCQSIVQNEKVTLEEVLDGPKAATGISAMMGKLTGKPVTAGGFVTAGPAEALLHASSRTYAPAPGMAAFKNPKVLFLSGALAVVLIIMSTILRNPSNLLGPRADSKLVAANQKEEEKPSSDHSGEEKTEEESSHSTEGEPETKEVEPGTESHSEKEGTEHHEESNQPTQTETKDTPSTNDSHGEPAVVNDPRVPGEPTVDTSNLIIARENKTEAKTTAPKKTATPPKTASHTPKKNPNPAPRKRSTPPKKKAATPSKGGGIKVYDSSGKPIG